MSEVEIGAAAPAIDIRPARPRLARGRNWILASGDLAALTAAYAVTYLVADQIAPPAVSAPAPVLVALAVLAVPFWIAVLTAYRLYENDSSRISIASFDEVGDIFHALVTASLAFLLLSQVLTRLTDWRIYSAVEAMIFVTAGLAFVPLVRGTIRSWIFPQVMQRRRALIVGSASDAHLLHTKLEAHPEYGLDVVGVIDGGGAQVADLVDDLDIDRVFLAGSTAAHEEMLDLIRSVRRPDVQVSIVPRYFEIFTTNAAFDEVQGMPIVSLPAITLGRGARVLKRAFDVVLSATALLVLLPVLLGIAIAVKIDSRGPAIFRQPRRGRDGSVFRIAKFRTMVDGAEARRNEVLHLNEVDGPLFKIKGGDPRATRVGNFLRRTSLDELPQLWNVLKGEMSLVGPRPFVLYEADRIHTGWAGRRLDMTPGVTGLWQVLGRNDMPFDEMVKLDYVYVTNWSLWWDLKILCQTIPVVLGHRGAY